MKRRNRGERKQYRKENRERKKRLQPYKPQVRRKRKHNWVKNLICVFVLFILLGVGMLFGINAYVKHKVAEQILTPEAASELQDMDCILVLGCLVKDGGEPSHMLKDRLRRGVALYKAGTAPKLLMSGDHGRKDYNEVEAMRQYAIEQGVPSADIFMDHAGFSTYDSCFRAKEIFTAKKIVIVTQEYHLYRALYIAEALGMEAYGVASDYRTYYNQSMREIRELFARVKDFLYVLLRPDPVYLGEQIPIDGDGNVTNDK